MRITDFSDYSPEVADLLAAAWNAQFGTNVLPRLDGRDKLDFDTAIIHADWAAGEVTATITLDREDWLRILDGEDEALDGDDYSACDGTHESSWSFDPSGSGSFSVYYEDGGTGLENEPFSSLYVIFR